MEESSKLQVFGSWSTYEVVWLIVFCGIAVTVELIGGEGLFEFSVFLSGVLCVLLAAKGNILTFPIGLYNTLGYAWIAYSNGLFGEMGLNLFFFLPMNIVGFLMWRRKMHVGTVLMRKMTFRASLLLVVVCIAGIVGLGYLLAAIPGQNTPFIDATTNVLSVAATVLMNMRYREQWILYLTLDAFTVIMWVIRMAAGSPEGATMVVMWVAYLINAVYGMYVWSKGARHDAEEV